MSAFGRVRHMQRELWDRVAFAAKLRSIEEAPEPFRSAMVTVLKSRDVVRLLIFGPARESDRQGLTGRFIGDTGTRMDRRCRWGKCRARSSPMRFRAHFARGDGLCPRLRQVAAGFCQRWSDGISRSSIQHSDGGALSRGCPDFVGRHGRDSTICTRRLPQYISLAKCHSTQIS